MFDCRACAAKDAEIARLVAERQDLLDRFLVLTGHLAEPRAQDLIPSIDIEPSGEAVRELTDEEWQRQELQRAENSVRNRFGRDVLPDLPAGA